MDDMNKEKDRMNKEDFPDAPNESKRLQPRHSRLAGKRSSHIRNGSTPHHITVQSLASLDAPLELQQLQQMSTDLKLQRELQRALLSLQEKEEDFRVAVEIGERLTNENNNLKEQMEKTREELHEFQSENQRLLQTLTTLKKAYDTEIKDYTGQLEDQKDLLHSLKEELKLKEKELEKEQGLKGTSDEDDDDHLVNELANNLQDRDHIRHRSWNSVASLGSLTSADFSTQLEKQLFLNLEEEKHKNMENVKRIEELLEKIDDNNKVFIEYDKLKQDFNLLKQEAEEEIDTLRGACRTMEQEVIALAARNSNLEQEKQELVALIEQRDYELQMFNAQLTLRKQSTVSSHLSGTLLSDMNLPQSPRDFNNINNNNNLNNINSNNTNINTNTNTNNNTNTNDNNDDTDKEGNKKPEKFVPDVIKEYLHLTASAVKIKFSKINTITSEQLIKQVQHLPFFQYYDYMSNIMKNEQLKQNEKEAQQNNLNNKNYPKKSGLFGLLGSLFGKEEDDKKEYDKIESGKSNETPNTLSSKRPSQQLRFKKGMNVGSVVRLMND